MLLNLKHKAITEKLEITCHPRLKCIQLKIQMLLFVTIMVLFCKSNEKQEQVSCIKSQNVTRDKTLWLNYALLSQKTVWYQTRLNQEYLFDN